MTRTLAAECPLFVVCYDISDDRERRRVDRLLLGYGHRRQHSVFECRLPVAARRRLNQQLEALRLCTGHVRIYRVFAGAASPVIGAAPADPDDVFCYTA